MAAWSLKTLKFFFLFFCVLGKTTLTGKFSKFCSERIPRYTDRRVVFKFREIWPTEIGKVVRYLLDKDLACLYAAIAAWIAPKICQGQRQTMGYSK